MQIERLRTGAPALMDGVFQKAIEAASAAFAGGRSIRMPSGAGHDAQVLATIMPAGMLFVPSIGGISHHWTENTADADIVTGARVFADACFHGGMNSTLSCAVPILFRPRRARAGSTRQSW